MKFSDGYWQLRDGVHPLYPVHVRDVAAGVNSLSVYAPTRRGLERFIDMPPIEGRMIGEQIPGRIVDMLREDPDQAEWLRRLRETGATHLVVMKYDPARPDRTIAAP